MSPRSRTKGREGWPDRMTRHPHKDKSGEEHIYYGWEDPRTGKEVSLKAKDNFGLAKQRADALNALLAKEEHAQFLAGAIEKPKATSGHTWGEWCDRYMNVVQSTRRLAKNTLKSKRSNIKRLRELIGEDTDVLALTVAVFNTAFDAERELGHKRQAQAMRSCAIDMMNEMTAEGWFPEDRRNPAEVTRNPAVPIQRERFTLKTFLATVECAKAPSRPWVENAMWLALISGQRREDVVEFRFKRGKDWEAMFEEMLEAARQDRAPRLPHPYPHIHEDMLCVVQQKGGNLVRIPLDLRLEAVNMSLREAVSRCRDSVASQYLIHHVKRRTLCKPGDQVFLDTVTKAVSAARNRAGLKFSGKPPTYHEIRSLSSRLYTEERGEGFAQALLGHKDPRMTVRYRDPRGVEWVEVKVA